MINQTEGVLMFNAFASNATALSKV